MYKCRGGSRCSTSAPKAAAPKAAAPKAAPKAAAGQGSVKVNSPMPGKILSVKTSVGQAVKKGEVLMILEAMKMELQLLVLLPLVRLLLHLLHPLPLLHHKRYHSQ